MNARHIPAPAAPDESTKRVWQILEATTDCVWMVNKNWQFIFLNTRAIATIAEGRDLLGMDLWEAFPGALGTPFESCYRQALGEKIAVSFEAFYPDLGILFEVHANPSGDDLAVFFRDITAQRAKDVELRKIEERYRLATLSTTEGIWDRDHVTDVAYFSNRWQEIVGLPAVEFIGTMDHWRRRFHPKDIPRMEQDYAELQTQGSVEFQYEYRICHEDHSWHWLLSRGTVGRDVSGKIIRMTGSISDITEKKSIDPLTGLHNRLSLLENLDNRLGKPLAKREPFAVILICINRFTHIQDSLGQAAVDAVLIETARRIQSTLEGDSRSVAARVDSHEFVILLEEITAVEDVATYAQYLQFLLETPMEYDGQQVSISTCTGIAMGDEGYTNPEKMLGDAAVALHQAEKRSKTRCVVFGTEMRAMTRRRVKIETDLQAAVQGRQLVLHYQPKVELRTGRIVGFEALVRWLHPTLGMIPPNDFIPYAEQSGLILDIGHWTLHEAMQQLMTWRKTGLVAASVTMAVNLSTRQLEDPDLVRQIQNTLTEEHALPQYLVLEVTESALIGNIDHAKELLGNLRRFGVSLDLDDFGTGYSSLSYLHRLPFHAIKIDRSFIRELEGSQQSRAIAQSIIQLGKSMNMDVIAEGIETTNQRNRLIKLGCLYGQGYFYSRPLDAKTMERTLIASNLARTA